MPKQARTKLSDKKWLPIRYRGFWDIPRMIAVEYGEWVYLLDCPFDDALDDYPQSFDVYRLSRDLTARFDEPSWVDLPRLGEKIGQLSVDDIELDPSARAGVNASFLEHVVRS
jgi:hypothetical protein